MRTYLKVKKCKYAFLSIFWICSYVHRWVFLCTHVRFFICRVDYQAWIESHRIIKVSASLVQHKKDMTGSRVFSAGVPQTLPLGFWLTCIVELRVGPTTVDGHRLMLLLCHGHAQRGHGAFMNKSLETGHTQKPVIYTSPFPATALQNRRKQMHSILGVGGKNVAVWVGGGFFRNYVLYLLMSLFVFSSDSLSSTGV